MAALMPLPLVLSLAYVSCRLIVRRKNRLSPGRALPLYAGLRVAVVLLALPLFVLGGIIPPVSYVIWGALGSVSGFEAILELALMPFTISGIIYLGLRLSFRLMRGNMRDYLDYGVITYYVSMTIIVCYAVLII